MSNIVNFNLTYDILVNKFTENFYFWGFYSLNFHIFGEFMRILSACEIKWKEARRRLLKESGRYEGILIKLHGAKKCSGYVDKIMSLWKWFDNTWIVYLPRYGLVTTEQYAESKSFEVLTEINPGEGFWINANSVLELLTE